MSQEEYYTPPADSIFEDVKQGAIKVWSDYDDTYNYATEKISRIKDITNIQDNCAYMVAMFDQDNQAKLYRLVSDETRAWLDKLLD